jgi:hypothetical protein
MRESGKDALPIPGWATLCCNVDALLLTEAAYKVSSADVALLLFS